MANPQVQLDPIYSLPFLYIQGLYLSVPVLSGSTSTLLAVGFGQCRDMNDAIDMPVGSPDFQGLLTAAPLILNSAVNGVNGLDQGTLAASSDYMVWLIGDSRGYHPVAAIMSLAVNASPLLPAGYDSMRLIGLASTGSDPVAFTTDSVAVVFTQQEFFLQPPISVLSAGTSATFAAIDLSSAMGSAQFKIAYLTVNFTPNAAGDTVQFRATGSTATTGLVTIVGQVAGVPQQNKVIVFVGQGAGPISSIDYKLSSASDSVSVLVSGYLELNNS